MDAATQRSELACDAPAAFHAAPCSPVVVLFARADSIYKSMPGLDVWDMARDARKFRGAGPVVAHPPCRAWGCLRAMAKPRPDEKDLALYAVNQVRLNGGVLEHPAGSTLWPVAKLPEPGDRDAWGGFTIVVPQFWWGHQANKATRLYICGCGPGDLPPVPLVLVKPRSRCPQRAKNSSRPDSRKKNYSKRIARKPLPRSPPGSWSWRGNVIGGTKSSLTPERRRPN